MQQAQPNLVTICRKVIFSCGHRCYRPDLSESENQRLYGSAYSEHGHGHNYELKAYVEGWIEPETGMVINLRDLDSVLKEVIEPLDHHHLNFDVPYFEETVPTSENIAAYCFAEIALRLKDLPVKLKKVRLVESPALWVDCEATSEEG
jgi:6-pyruvoyltetrahydropterin/6-carboxytetrahydropterin synthase